MRTHVLPKAADVKDEPEAAEQASPKRTTPGSRQPDAPDAKRLRRVKEEERDEEDDRDAESDNAGVGDNKSDDADNDDNDDASGSSDKSDNEDDDKEDTDSDSAVMIERKKARRRGGRRDKVEVGVDHKRMYRMNMASKPDPGKMMQIVDMLKGSQRGTAHMRGDVMEDICKLYDDRSAWEPGSQLALDKFKQDLAIHGEQLTTTNVTYINPRECRGVQLMLARHPSSAVNTETLRNEMINLVNIEPIPREWEDGQLRSPVGQERPCVNGERCLCNRTRWFGFIMKEFISPQDAVRETEDWQRDATPKACLLCIREVCHFFQSLRAVTGLAPPERYVYQAHRNIVNVPGEYMYSDCIRTGLGTIYPVLMNKRDGYSHIESDGRHWLRQTGYKVVTADDVARLDFRGGVPRAGD
jgi:hypothetical protein